MCRTLTRGGVPGRSCSHRGGLMSIEINIPAGVDGSKTPLPSDVGSSSVLNGTKGPDRALIAQRCIVRPSSD
jgi:hypothetical protein